MDESLASEHHSVPERLGGSDGWSGVAWTGLRNAYSLAVAIRNWKSGMAVRHSVLAIVLGVVAASAMVAGSYAGHAAGAHVVQFNGVRLDTVYLNDSPEVFGPAVQNACNESLPTGPSWPGFGPECPAQLVGGVSYDIVFFMIGHVGSLPGLWANMTVTAPFAFQVNPGTAGDIPTAYSGTTGLFESGDHFLYTGGEWMGWALVFTMPTRFSFPPGGLWLNASLTIQPTNQTAVE